MTEVGAVLVGGGELHDRWSSLVGVSEPLGRGIQRFTGITQQMVDEAPPPADVLPALAEQLQGRLLVAHNARFDVGVLKQAFERAELEWPDPPVLCTVALARRLAPLQRRRGLASLADALGIEVSQTHRALPDAETCARVLCALLPRLCANARTIAEALQVVRPRKPPRFKPVGAQAPARRAARPQLAPQGPGRLHLPRRRRASAVRRQVGLPAHARAGALHDAGDVDRAGRARRLPADRVRARRARAREPADQGAQAARQHAAQEGRRRLRVPALPARHPVPDPRGRARARSRPRGLHRPGARPRRRRRARRAAQLACSGCATAAARSRTAPHPSAYGQMGRCLSPCLGDLDPEPLPRAARRGAAAVRGRRRVGAARPCRRADARGVARRSSYERAAWLRRRGAAARVAAAPARRRAARRARRARGSSLAPHPAEPARADAFWIVAGRVADWGPLPTDVEELAGRTDVALAAAPSAGLGGWLPADELDELRIVGSWLAGHEDVRVLELEPRPDQRALAAFTASPTADRPRTARRAAPSARARVPVPGS